MVSFPLPRPMRLALDLAAQAASRGEVPVGAVIMRGDVVIASAANAMCAGADPTAHAEMEAIRAAAAALGAQRLDDCDLYVTLEPCAMCAGAISHARLRRLYYGAEDIKGGGVDNGVRFFNQPTCHHTPDVYSGLSGRSAAEILKDFFSGRR